MLPSQSTGPALRVTLLLERLFEEQSLAVQRLFALLRTEANVVTVCVHLPGVGGVVKLEVEEAPDLFAVTFFTQGEELLHAPVEITLHQIGRAQVDLLVLSLPERIDPCVLQE